MKKYVFGVDIGGTGCKCVAFSEHGVQLGLAYAEYSVPSGTVHLPCKLKIPYSHGVMKLYGILFVLYPMVQGNEAMYMANVTVTL